MTWQCSAPSRLSITRRVPGAVADGVDNQFVYGQNDVTGPELRHPGLDNMGGHGGAQRIQRSGVEG